MPVFLPLKDYRADVDGIVDFVWRTIKSFNGDVSRQAVVEALEDKRMILLMDGLDEIQSSVRENFNTDLEAFIRSYPGNVVVISSRPVYAFVSYTRFSLFDIQPLTKAQALELIKKLKFWDEDNKQSFLKALDEHLFSSHYEFASNPLLLTIMLMTYSEFGEVPAKMHVFYAKAYETMARLHDATKGSFKRPLHTGLTPEEFAKYYAEFCARTYMDEIFEFDNRTFQAYMNKVIKHQNSANSQKSTELNARDFKLDLTDNLCIMYQEGDILYFIHRSFQEYFAALYFSSVYDESLYKVGKFFDKMQHRSYSDTTFDMLYDMIPKKVERYIFLPFLQDLINSCEAESKEQEYWNFLMKEYPIIYVDEGKTGDTDSNEPQSFLYATIVQNENLSSQEQLDDLQWPGDIHAMPSNDWVDAFESFLSDSDFDNFPDPDSIPDDELDVMERIYKDDLPIQYDDYFGEPEVIGKTYEIEMYKLEKNPIKYKEIRDFMLQPNFPLYQEYENVKRYYKDLKSRADKEQRSDELFDD